MKKITFETAIELIKSTDYVMYDGYAMTHPFNFTFSEDKISVYNDIEDHKTAFLKENNSQIALIGSILNFTEIDEDGRIFECPFILLFEDKFLADKAQLIEEKLSYSK